MFSHDGAPHSGCMARGTAQRDLVGSLLLKSSAVLWHSSSAIYDVFITFACNPPGRACAIERGSFGPLGFVRLQMQELEAVGFVARLGVSPALREVSSKPWACCSLPSHRIFSQGFDFQGFGDFWPWSAPFKLIFHSLSRFTHKS